MRILIDGDTISPEEAQEISDSKHSYLFLTIEDDVDISNPLVEVMKVPDENPVSIYLLMSVYINQNEEDTVVVTKSEYVDSMMNIGLDFISYSTLSKYKRKRSIIEEMNSKKSGQINSFPKQEKPVKEQKQTKKVESVDMDVFEESPFDSFVSLDDSLETEESECLRMAEESTVGDSTREMLEKSIKPPTSSEEVIAESLSGKYDVKPVVGFGGVTGLMPGEYDDSYKIDELADKMLEER